MRYLTIFAYAILTDKTIRYAILTDILAFIDDIRSLARVGAHLAKQSPDFDARNYGFARMSDLADASGILEVERTGEQNKVVGYSDNRVEARRSWYGSFPA